MRSLGVLVGVVWLAAPALAAAADKSGVTASAISLPSGPGSIEGLGESFEPTLNTGTAKYGLTLAVPLGPAGHAPAVALAYEGGRGNGPLGFGWQVPVPYVQRQTDKGIPRYADTRNAIDDDGDGLVDEADEALVRDTFLTDGGEELVETVGGDFFCENESAFVRYRRVAGTCAGPGGEPCLADVECGSEAACAGVHWEGTLPNGTRHEYGVTPAGRVTDAGTGRIFKWLLERVVDTNGNTIVYGYRGFDGEENWNQRYLETITYGPGAPPWAAFHFLAFTYEPRSDWFEDGRPGFLCRTGMRLASVAVGTQGVALGPLHATGDFNGDGAPDALNRRYLLAYKGDPHWSLLTSVTLIGADDVNPLPPMRLAYTTASLPETVSAAAETIGAENPPVQLMDTGLVDLIDLDGDGLPDMLNTDGVSHTAYRNEGETPAGEIRWAAGVDVPGAPEDAGELGRHLAWTLSLASDAVHLADMDGDGLADLVATTLDDVVYFRNQGDLTWGARRQMILDPTQSAPPAPFRGPNVATADLDFDKRMDVIQSVAVGPAAVYRIWFNQGGGRYAPSVTVPQEEGGEMLGAPGVHLADVNGDRVPDVVRVTPTGLHVAAGLGHGRFAPRQFVELRLAADDMFVFGDAEAARAGLEDINGDGLADLVLEQSGVQELSYWVNRGNYTLDARRTVTDLPVPFGFTPATRWADMNGNGTIDLVYADGRAHPRLQTVDLGRLLGCEPSPHLLRLVDNSIGRRITIEYRSAASFAVAAGNEGNPWRTTSRVPLEVVGRVTTTPGLELDGRSGEDAYVTDFVYRDAFYEGSEKEFRGFGWVKKVDRGDPECDATPPGDGCSGPTLVTRFTFHTGAPDAIDNDGDGGIDEHTEAGGAEDECLKGRTLRVEQTTAAAGADSGAGDGADAAPAATFQRSISDWTIRRLHSPAGGTRASATVDGREVSFAFVRQDNTHVIELGGHPAEQLRVERMYDDYGNVLEERHFGALSRDGDERFTTTVYARNFERWIVSRPARVTVADGAGVGVTTSRIYYDGPDFAGLPEGQVTRGNPSRQQGWVAGDHWVDQVRSRYDHNGNVIAILDALGDPGAIKEGHGREVEYDPLLRALPVHERVYLGSGREPLTVGVEVDVGLGIVTTSFDANEKRTTYGHDVFARPTSIVRPGDSTALPTLEFTYRMADPTRGVVLSYDRVGKVTRQTGVVTASVVEMRGRIDAGAPETLDAFEVVDGLGRKLALFEEDNNGFVVKNVVRFNARAQVRETLLPHRVSTVMFAAPPENGARHRFRYDATGRQIRLVSPPDANGIVSAVVTRPAPLRTVVVDELGNEQAQVKDGLDRLVEQHRANGDELYVTRYAYNAANSLRRVVDPQDNVTGFDYDGLQRRVLLEHPDQGRTTLTYDDASNARSSVDAKGQRTTFAYDGANRVVTEDYHDEAKAFSQRRTPDVTFHYDIPAGAVPAGDGATRTGSNTRGMLAWVEDLSGEEHRSYDDRGRVSWVLKRVRHLTEESLTSYTTGMTYDSRDRLRTLQYPDGDQITVDYDARGLVERIHAGAFGDVIAGVDHTPAGQMLRVVYGNNVVSRYVYDPRIRLIGRETVLASEIGAPLVSLQYDLDPTGNVRGITDLRPASLVPPGDPRRNTQVFEYDHVHRLTKVDYPRTSGDTTGSFGSIAYTYDRIGNTLSQGSDLLHEEGGRPVANLGALRYGGSGGTMGRQPRGAGDSPGPHALTTIGTGPETQSLAYDDNGNVVSDGIRVLTWDFKDRLVRLERDKTRVEYVYDHADRRVVKRVSRDGDAPVVVTYVDRSFEVREGDVPVKHVFNGAVRVARITGAFDSRARRAQRIRLTAGWNLVSLAVAADDAVVQIEGSDLVDELHRWGGEQQGFVAVTALDVLAAGTVLWMHASTAGVLVVTGVGEDAETLPVPEGAGYFAGPGFERLRLDENLGSTVVGAWVWNPSTQEWHARLAPPLNFLSSAPPWLPAGSVAYLRSVAPSEVSLAPRATRIRYYHPDHTGSSTVVTDGAGSLVEETAFYPFGAARQRHRPRLSAAPEPYLFAGNELDDESGLMSFGHRYFDPVLGRFLGIDPRLGLDWQKEGLLAGVAEHHGYAFAASNPLRFSDDDGLKIEIIGSKQFVADVRSMIKFLRSHGQGKLIRELKRSETVVFIVPVAQGYNAAFSASGESETHTGGLILSPGPHIRVNSREGFLMEAGMMSPAEVLLHEIGHAAKFLRDPGGQQFLRSMPLSPRALAATLKTDPIAEATLGNWLNGFGDDMWRAMGIPRMRNGEEARNLMATEWPGMKGTGGPRRKDYEDDMISVPVAGPTSRTPLAGPFDGATYGQ